MDVAHDRILAPGLKPNQQIGVLLFGAKQPQIAVDLPVAVLRLFVAARKLLEKNSSLIELLEHFERHQVRE